MKRLLVAVVMCVAIPLALNVEAFDLNWGYPDPPIYSDNTLIEPALLPVMFDAWQDGVQIANGVTAKKVPLADNTFGTTHTYKVRARLKDGRTSADLVQVIATPADDRQPAACSVGSMRITK